MLRLLRLEKGCDLWDFFWFVGEDTVGGHSFSDVRGMNSGNSQVHLILDCANFFNLPPRALATILLL